MHLDHTSRVAAAWSIDPAAPAWRQLDGTWVLVDLSGFTRLTESLTDRSADGAELLHRTLLTCFATLLDRAMVLGGDLIGFAGDAALVRFDGDGHVERGGDAAWAMPRGLAALPASVTGGRRLRVSTGVHTGPVTAVLTRTRQRGLFLVGPTISELVTLQDTAAAGQVLASPSVVSALPTSVVGEAIGSGRRLRRRLPDGTSLTAPPIDPLEPSTAALERTLTLLAPATRPLITAGARRGSYRTVSIGFVRIGGLDRIQEIGGPDRVADVLSEAAARIVDVTEELGVSWLDTDVGRGSVKVLLTAGAPDAVGDDEQRLLLALRRIVDTDPARLAAGAQRGRVFASHLGVPGRTSYTVLGDAANVAARALGLATDGEVVVANGLDVENRPSVSTRPLGAQVLKNHRRPVPMWRVDHVGPLAASRPAVRAEVAGAIRRDERDRIEAAWRDSAAGHGRRVSVVGEAGMGVSELIAGIVTRVGSVATAVSGDAFRRQVAYGVVGAVVESLFAGRSVDPRTLDAGDREGTTADGWTWLAGYAPALPAELADWVEPALAMASGRPSRSPEDARTAAARTRQVLAGLLAAAAPTPWLLAVDRLEDVDEASRSILRALQTATVDRPMMILTGGAAVEPGEHDPFVTTETVELRPLDPAEAASVLHSVAPALRDEQIERIVGAAGGNPFVLAELTADPDSPELPDSLQRVAAVLLDALPAALREPVQDASAFGIGFEPSVVAGVLDRPDLATAAAWADADAIVRVESDGSLWFRHAAYRAAAYESLPHRHRRELHGAIADHLARSGVAGDATLALHLQAAGRIDHALPLAVSAGRRAKSNGALVEAADLLDRAVEMARRVDRSLVGELLVERGEALAWLGDLTGASAAYRRARRAVDDARLGARLCHLEADVALSRGDRRRVVDRVRAGLALADSCPDRAPAERCRLLLDRGWDHHYRGRHENSRAVAEQALAVATEAADPELLGMAHLQLEMALSVVLDPGAVAHGDLALEHFASIGHDRYLGVALSNTGLTLMHLGRWDEALDRYERSTALARRLGRTADVALAELNAGFVRFRRREYAEAEALARRAWRTFDVIAYEPGRGFPRLLCGMIAAATERWDEADSDLAAARERFVAVGDDAMVVDCDVVRVAFLVARGRLVEAHALTTSVEPSLSVAEADVVIAHGRLLGQIEALLGIASGHDRMLQALERARSQRLVYDELLCLTALVEVERAGGPAAPAGAAADVADIERRLGLGQHAALTACAPIGSGASG